MVLFYPRDEAVGLKVDSLQQHFPDLSLFLLEPFCIYEKCAVYYFCFISSVGFYFPHPQSLTVNTKDCRNLSDSRAASAEAHLCLSSTQEEVTGMRYDCKMSNIHRGPELFSCH